jgi:hypothetical protein
MIYILYIKANVVSVCVDKNWAVLGRFFQSMLIPCGVLGGEGRESLVKHGARGPAQGTGGEGLGERGANTGKGGTGKGGSDGGGPARARKDQWVHYAPGSHWGVAGVT